MGHAECLVRFIRVLRGHEFDWKGGKYLARWKTRVQDIGIEFGTFEDF